MKMTAFHGKEPVRAKIIINSKPIEQVLHFNYLGCDISYNYDNDIDRKLNKYQSMCGTIRRTFKVTNYKRHAIEIL